MKIIEDCSQAHGASIENKKIGSFGDVSTWSFCTDKIISTLGEGGMISTNKKNYMNFANHISIMELNLKIVIKNLISLFITKIRLEQI